MPSREEILGFIRRKGAAIPNDIKREFGGDTFLIGAILSEMVKEGHLKVSHTKLGGSPFYYAKGQEQRLLELIKHLNEKDRKTVELLKEKKILRDKDQEMLIRVSLRNIKDFAKQIEVKVKGEKEIFWKWYLTSMDEASNMIRKHYAAAKPEEEQTKAPEPEKKPEPIKEEPKEKTDNNKENKSNNEEEQQTFKDDKPKESNLDDDFSKKLHRYFEDKGVTVEKENIIRKGSEIEYNLKMPTAVGKVDYFCKAKSKKRCNDGDLSSAYLKGQTLKLPVLFITTGEITKKAESMIDNEFKGMVVKRI